MSVLKNGTYGFTLLEWGQTRDHEVAEGWGKKNVACFKQIWTPIGTRPEDYEVYDASMPAVIPVYGLYDPDKGTGVVKGGKIGFDIPRPWEDFLAMFRASGANPDIMGKPEYLTGTQPGTLDIEVKALPGSGNFAPKNVLVSWRNRQKTETAIAMFKSALSAALSSTPKTQVKIVNPMGSGT